MMTTQTALLTTQAHLCKAGFPPNCCWKTILHRALLQTRICSMQALMHNKEQLSMYLMLGAILNFDHEGHS